MSIRTPKFPLMAIACALLAPPMICQAAAPARKKPDRNAEIVDAFILYDVGQLRGQEGQAANAAFRALAGDEAIPALVHGVNKAARMRQSCPIIVVAGKLSGMLEQAKDREMVEYAVTHLDRSGANVHYGNYVDRLREQAERLLRGDELYVPRELRGGTVDQFRRLNKPLKDWTLKDLEESVHLERDTLLLRVLEELVKRKGAQHTDAMARAIDVVPEDVKEVARGLLAQRLVRMKDRTLIAKLEDPNIEVRAAAVRAIGYKGSPLYKELAAAMRDKQMVAEYAHQALVKLSGEDLGPSSNAAGMQWYRASKRWEDWAKEKKPSRDEQKGT